MQLAARGLDLLLLARRAGPLGETAKVNRKVSFEPDTAVEAGVV